MLSVIIPTKDRVKILNKTIGSLVEAIKGIDAEIIVVNDSNSDITFPDQKNILILNSRRSSAAVSRNLGAKNAKGNVLLFLDDDIVIDHACLKELYNRTLIAENVIYLPNWEYPKTINDHLSKTSFGRFVIRANYNNLRGYLGNPEKWSNEKMMAHDGVASYCLMLKKELFDNINGYSEKFSFAGFEDHDLSIKITQQKTKIFIDPKLFVFHNEEDKLQMTAWLTRMEKGAVTRKQAVNIGYQDLKINYNASNSVILPMVYVCRNIFISFSNLIPNKTFFDPFYSLIFKILISSYIYKGYNSMNDN